MFHDDEKLIPIFQFQFQYSNSNIWIVKPSSSQHRPRQRQRRVQHPQHQWQTWFSKVNDTKFNLSTEDIFYIVSVKMCDLLFESSNGMITRQAAALRHLQNLSKKALKQNIFNFSLFPFRISYDAFVWYFSIKVKNVSPNS